MSSKTTPLYEESLCSKYKINEIELVIKFYVVTWEGLMPSPLGDYFSIIELWNTEEAVIVYTI
jgi:hypothetical protein